MVDPILEIDRLRHNLRAKGIAEQLIDTICGQATREISSMITDAVSNAVQEAVAAGIDKDSKDFISEIRASRVGNTFNIVTDSGRTDFSNPPYPMLPWLLKNPKVAKDGSLYKVIPVGSKSSNQKLSDITQVQEMINNTRNQSRAQLDNGKDVFSGATTFSGDFAAQKNYTKNLKTNQAIQERTGKPTFRTVSSKQDANSQWVLPAKDADMSQDLSNINKNLEIAIENAIISIVQFYTESY